MTRYLLDTNIISDITKPVPSEALLAWMEDQADDDLFIASMTVAEIRRGVLEKPIGRKRTILERWFSGLRAPSPLRGPGAALDEKAALIWARLMAEGRSGGRSRSALDMIIAAIAEANDCIVATDNAKHFTGLQFVNPLRST